MSGGVNLPTIGWLIFEHITSRVPPFTGHGRCWLLSCDRRNSGHLYFCLIWSILWDQFRLCVGQLRVAADGSQGGLVSRDRHSINGFITSNNHSMTIEMTGNLGSVENYFWPTQLPRPLKKNQRIKMINVHFLTLALLASGSPYSAR